MGKETAKAFERRLRAGYFVKYLTGHGLDIGAGDDLLRFYLSQDERTVFSAPANFKVDGWDKENGDATYLHTIKDSAYDFVYSSHCLEHLALPDIALINWWRVLKPGGYLFFVVPDERLYEQGVWPSRGNGEHKTKWSLDHSGEEYYRDRNERNPVVEVATYLDNAQIISAQLIDTNYDYELAKHGWRDQSDVAEVGIEVIVRKLK